MKTLNSILNEKQLKELDINQQKKILREYFLDLRENEYKKSFPENWGPKQFFRTLELLKIKNLNDIKNKFIIACFFPIKFELNIATMAQSNWLFPKMQEDKELLWFEYGDGKTDYIENKYGIKEKKDSFCFPYTAKTKPMLCFVPGLVAAQNGDRLGYGGGFYDRFLHKFKDQVTSVLCLPSRNFLIDKLPRNEFDEKIDLIVF